MEQERKYMHVQVPWWRDMLRVAAEVQDVPLGEAHVLEQHPGGVREVRDFDADELQGPVAHGVVEVDVRPAAFQ